jgi:ABC-type lipoprotein release transport system permease subunit
MTLRWTSRVWDAVRLDVRHSFRSLRQAPTFSLIVVVTRAQLYGIAPDDIRTLLIAAVISLAMVVAASWLPALRASRVAPVEALREE